MKIYFRDRDGVTRRDEIETVSSRLSRLVPSRLFSRRDRLVTGPNFSSFTCVKKKSFSLFEGGKKKKKGPLRRRRPSLHLGRGAGGEIPLFAGAAKGE